MRLVNGRLVGDDEAPLDTPTLEAVPEAPDNPEGYPTCAECGQLNYEWTPGSRGRKPKYHEECRPISPSRSGSSTSPRRSATIRNEAALREALAARYLLISQIAAWRHPAYAAGIRDKIDRAVEADIAYARVNPGFRKALEGILSKTAAGEVIAVHVAMFAPVIVGEAASRGRKKAGKVTGEGRRPAPESPRPTEQPPPQRPDNVHPIREDMPGEHAGPGPETINAAAMDGMPGGI